MSNETDVENKPTSTDVSDSGIRVLRIWPVVVLLIALWLMWLVPGWMEEIPFMVQMLSVLFGPALCMLLMVVWWLFASRATLLEKLVGFIGLLMIVAATTLLAHPTIQGFGTMIYAVPWGTTAFGAVLIITSRMRSRTRTWLALLAALLAFGYWDAIRSDGLWGDFCASFSWRWAPTTEERFLKNLAQRPTAAPSEIEPLSPTSLADPEWPGFRGPHRDGVQPGVVLQENWDAQPPKEIWRIQIGPGWSSFAVVGDRLFTQEQRGEQEAVVCYHAETGEQIWAHTYPSRFWEAMAGAGPRATPTLYDGKLFALGAKGLLFRLDPATGDVVWKKDLREDASRQPPTWGFSSSPLGTGEIVIVHAGGTKDKGVIAYDVESGEQAWCAPAGDHSYSSPHLAKVAGEASVLMLTNEGLSFINPDDGAVQGKHEWLFEGYRVVQPTLVGDSSLLLGTAMRTGTRRIEVKQSGDQMVTEESWTSKRMSPYYNDFVVHKGHLYGFDKNIFSCVDLKTGQRKWKKGRYGCGQVLLLPDDDQLLVISETGELVLLRTDPDKLVEKARHQALNGKTWNHPVLVGDRLYVRNGEEAACFGMPVR